MNSEMNSDVKVNEFLTIVWKFYFHENKTCECFKANCQIIRLWMPSCCAWNVAFYDEFYV